MSKKKNLLTRAWGGKHRKRERGISLGSTWGSGRDNALATGWGGKSKRGGGLIPRAWGGKSKRGSVLTPAVWGKRGRRKAKGGKLLMRSFGLSRSKRNRGQRLSAAWGRHPKAKRGTLLGALGLQHGRRGRRPKPGTLAFIFAGKRSRRRKRGNKFARAFARALALLQLRSRDDEMIQRRRMQADEALAELSQDATLDTSEAAYEAVEAKATQLSEERNPLRILFARIRDRFRRLQPPTA